MIRSAQEYLLNIPLWTRKKNTLSQVRDFLSEMGNPDRQMKIVHVAGSNGKGSVCADLTAVLTVAGYRVGTFVSPHLSDIRERILLDGKMVDRERFGAAFETVYRLTQVMVERGYQHPAFFEFLFLMAMQVFADWQPDYVILETGLGGRLDTTNVIEMPVCTVITSVSLEHTQYLGDTIPQIAGEKAGIIKPGVPVVYDDNQRPASAVIQRVAREQHAPAYPVSEQDSYAEVHFAAPYQAMNAALAVKALDVMADVQYLKRIDRELYRRGLEQVYWPGRMEPAGDDVWLDGAHSPDGIRAFIRAAQEMQKKNLKNLQILFAVAAEKDYNNMIQLLCQELKPAQVTVTHLDNERALATDTLVTTFRQYGCPQVTAYADVKAALSAALQQKTASDRLFIVGSLYLIGEIRMLMGK